MKKGFLLFQVVNKSSSANLAQPVGTQKGEPLVLIALRLGKFLFQSYQRLNYIRLPIGSVAVAELCRWNPDHTSYDNNHSYRDARSYNNTRFEL